MMDCICVFKHFVFFFPENTQLGIRRDAKSVFIFFVHSVLTGFYCRLVSSAMQWIGHDGLAVRLTDSLLWKQLATKTASSRPFGSTSGYLAAVEIVGNTTLL